MDVTFFFGAVLVNFGEVFLISKSIKRYQKYPLAWSPLPVIVSCNSQLKVLVKGIAYKRIVMIVMVLVVITGRQPKNIKFSHQLHLESNISCLAKLMPQ